MSVYRYLLCSMICLQGFCGVHAVEGDRPATQIKWHWEDSFSVGEREMVTTWLYQVTRSVEESFGPYPFDLQFYIHRKNASGEPVPWASTRREEYEQGVDFHIDPAYSLESFIEDWTAPHEISHLSIPFLGLDNAWFAEGYASFMQYQVMQEMGIYSADQVMEIYATKLDMARPHFMKDEPVVDVAKSLQRSHRYKQMYWGSASFFIQLDQMIRHSYAISLTDVVRMYQDCCRMNDKTIEEVLASWDMLLNGTACADLFQEYRTEDASDVFLKSGNF